MSSSEATTSEPSVNAETVHLNLQNSNCIANFLNLQIETFYAVYFAASKLYFFCTDLAMLQQFEDFDDFLQQTKKSLDDIIVDNKQTLKMAKITFIGSKSGRILLEAAQHQLQVDIASKLTQVASRITWLSQCLHPLTVLPNLMKTPEGKSDKNHNVNLT